MAEVVEETVAEIEVVYDGIVSVHYPGNNKNKEKSIKEDFLLYFRK